MDIKKKQIGLSDLYATQLGLGCINYGTTTDEITSMKLIEAYLDNGGNLLDTSNNYAFWNSKKERDSEKCIGKWIAANPKRRKEYILCTKLGALPSDMNKGFDMMQGNSSKVIFEEVEKSLEALQTDYIDLLYLHVDDRETALTETMEALDCVIKKGYVKNIGCSNFRTWRIEQARNICKNNNWTFFSAVQQRNSYLQPVMDADFGVQICADKEIKDYIEFYRDLTMVSHTSLLYGVYFKDTIDDSFYDTKQNLERLKEVQQQGENKIPWVLKKISEQYNGGVVLFTSSNTEHLISNMKYFSENA